MSTADSSKNVIVTGCASGIGRSTAKRYLQAGFRVIGLDMEPCTLTGLEAFFCCDLSDETALMPVSEQIKKNYASVNYLICCAGIFLMRTEVRSLKWTKQSGKRYSAAI